MEIQKGCNFAEQKGKRERFLSKNKVNAKWLSCLGINAKIAQLVEHDLAKVGVAGSSPVFRSRQFICKRTLTL